MAAEDLLKMKWSCCSNWGGRTRTSNFPVNSRAVCQLTYTPSHRNHPPHRYQTANWPCPVPDAQRLTVQDAKA